MKSNRLVVALALLLVLGGATYWQIGLRAGEDQGGDAPRLELPKLAREAIDELEFIAPNFPRVRMQQHGGEWRLVEPIEAKADLKAVSTALDKLEQLEVVSLVSTQTKYYELFEIGARDSTRVIVRSGGSVLLDAYLGATASGKSMLRLNGQPYVGEVAGAIRYAFNRSLSDWRDRAVTQLEAKHVRAVEFSNASGVFRFAREDHGWKQQPGPSSAEIAELDPAKVEAAVMTAANVNAIGIAEPTLDLAGAGLTQPTASAAIELDAAAGGGTLRLRIGAMKEQDFYLQREGDPTIFVVPRWIGQRLAPSAESFTRGDPARAAAAPAAPALDLAQDPSAP